MYHLGFRKMHNVCVYEKLRRLPYPYYREGEIWVKEKVHPLKIY